LYDTKNYGHIAKENAVLQTKLDKKTAQLNALTADYKQAQCDLNLVQSKLKKLKYENEKFYQDCQRLKEAPQAGVSADLSELTCRELENLECYH